MEISFYISLELNINHIKGMGFLALETVMQSIAMVVNSFLSVHGLAQILRCLYIILYQFAWRNL